MCVFKAAVVGAGTMGGEIAQAIASAGIPVVLKDVDERRVEHGLEEGALALAGPVDAGKLEPAARSTPPRSDHGHDHYEGSATSTS